jgi:carbohydrate-selective porin OprB
MLAALLCAVALPAMGQDEPPTDPDTAEKAADPPPDDQDQEGEDQDQDQDREGEQDEDQEKQEETPPPVEESADDITSQLEQTKADDAEAEATEADAAEHDPDADPDATDEQDEPDEPEQPQEEVVEADHESADDVGNQLEEASEPPKGLWDTGPIASLYDLWKPHRDEFSETTGIDLGMAYTSLAQIATRGSGDRNAWSGDFDVFGRWRIGDQDNNPGAVGFAAEQRHRLGQITPRDLGRQTGSLWRTTKGFNSQDLALVQLWWEQHLLENRVRIRAGKLDPSNHYNGNRFQNQNTAFMSTAFSANPARNFPSNGIGASMRIIPNDHFYVAMGLHDTNGTKTTTGLSNLRADTLFYALELGLTPQFEDLGPGRYRFTYWYTGEDGNSGDGFAFSAEQDLGNGVIPFLRYGYQDGGQSTARHLVAGGVGIQNAIGRKRDLLGIGVAWGEPDNDELRDQYLFETFYRIQLNPRIQLTPGYQVIFDPSRNPDQDVVGVFELRLRITF